MRVRPGFVERLGQFAFAPGFVLRGGDLDAVDGRMPACVQRMQQLALTQGQQAQYAVVHGQFALALEFAQQAAAIAARRLQRAPGDSPGQCCCAQGQAADHQVHTRTGSGAGGDSAAHAHPQLFEGFGVEQVVAPASVQQRQVAGRRVLGAKTVQLEQRLDAALFTLANRFAQLIDGLLLDGFFAGHATPARGAVNQQFRDQAQGAVFACFALGLLISDQALQRAA